MNPTPESLGIPHYLFWDWVNLGLLPNERPDPNTPMPDKQWNILKNWMVDFITGQVDY